MGEETRFGQSNMRLICLRSPALNKLLMGWIKIQTTNIFAGILLTLLCYLMRRIQQFFASEFCFFSLVSHFLLTLRCFYTGIFAYVYFLKTGNIKATRKNCWHRQNCGAKVLKISVTCSNWNKFFLLAQLKQFLQNMNDTKFFLKNLLSWDIFW